MVWTKFFIVTFTVGVTIKLNEVCIAMTMSHTKYHSNRKSVTRTKSYLDLANYKNSKMFMRPYAMWLMKNSAPMFVLKHCLRKREVISMLCLIGI